jgi:tRNA(Arg) A34 adenosine deaminase TadA
MLVAPYRVYPTVEDRIRFVTELYQAHIRHGTGGPFGATIFDREKSKLLTPGVNLILASSSSIVQAETVAIMIVQQFIGDFDLGGEGQPAYELVTSAVSCAMCLGAISWSGDRQLVCGAHDEEVQSIGFDEEPTSPNWVRRARTLGHLCRVRCVLRRSR